MTHDATITPDPDTAGRCERDGCECTELLALVEPGTDAPSRILCPTHRVKYLREVYQ